MEKMKTWKEDANLEKNENLEKMKIVKKIKILNLRKIQNSFLRRKFHKHLPRSYCPKRCLK